MCSVSTSSTASRLGVARSVSRPSGLQVSTGAGWVHALGAGRVGTRSRDRRRGTGRPRGYAGLVGLLAVDVSTFGAVMSADSQPIEALGGQTRVLTEQGGLTSARSLGAQLGEEDPRPTSQAVGTIRAK